MRAIKNGNHSHKVRRGEKEAISLRRRRIVKTAINVLTVTGMCLSVIGSIYLWRSGTFETWIDSAETKVGDGLVGAGLTVAAIKIDGTILAPEEDVRVAAGIISGDPLLAIDMGLVKEKVENLKWIKSAVVTRQLPDQIIINVVEHQPAALWQIDNKLWIMSDEGIQITDEQLEYFSDLPMISGAGADEQLGTLINAVDGNMDLFDRVETASWVGGRRWDLILKNGIKIMLPEDQLQEAWLNLVTFEQNEKLLARNILAVDFRVRDKTVVRLTPEEAARRRLLAKTSGNGEQI